MRTAHWLSLALAALVLAGPGLRITSAEELQTPPAPEASSVQMPKRGMSMDKVEAAFGAPTKRIPAVGGANVRQPPISRWEYPGFVVYFENDKVVHTVAIG